MAIIKKYYVSLSLVGVFICFFPLFYFSTEFIINRFAYSDALINYSEGFVRRGFLGEVIFKIYNLTNIKLPLIHSYIFIFFTSLNISLFILLLKNLSKARFVYIFLLLHPALLFFPLHDTAAYLRKEILMLTLMLFHCCICNFHNNGKLEKKTYFLFFYLFIIPGIILNMLMHDMQLFLIPFHFLLTLNVLNNNFKFNNLNNYLILSNYPLYAYILTIIPVIFFFIYPTDIDKLKLVADKIWKIDPEAWWGPISYTATPFLKTATAETKHMFSKDDFGTYNHLFNYTVLTVLSLTSIIYIFCKILKKKIKIYNHKFVFFSVFPLFLLFFIGRDWGRWLSMISWSCLLFYLQFEIKIEKEQFAISRSRLTNLILIILSIFFIFFMTVPHCCKGTTMFGGFSDNINLLINIVFKNSNHISDTFKGI